MDRDDLLDINFKEPEFSDTEIFTNIWTKPRAVLKFIHDRQYYKYFYVLLFIYGVSQSFDRASMRGLGDTLSLMPLFFTCFIFGGLFGWIGLYVFAALIGWTGRVILGGKASTKNLFHLFSYSTIPSCILLVITIIQIGFFGNQLFLSEGVLEPLPLVIGFGVIEVVFGIYSFVFLIVSISILQEFNIWNSILNVILGIVVVIIPILLLFVLFQ